MYAAEADYLAPYFSPDDVLHQADALPYGGTAGSPRFTRFTEAGVCRGFDFVYFVMMNSTKSVV
ncbi:hypothetical protein ALI144C_23520 [Actinosynnema sp. ALI-1.44]|nr:hypothetical protein ALI144C_23520 [Actinosynnema sp. ALI-1.44]